MIRGGGGGGGGIVIYHPPLPTIYTLPVLETPRGVCCGYRVWALRRVCQLCPRVPHNNCQQIYEHDDDDDDDKSVRPQLLLQFRIINIVAGFETSLSISRIEIQKRFRSVFLFLF